jgi:hypothetical protein
MTRHHPALTRLLRHAPERFAAAAAIYEPSFLLYLRSAATR